MEGDHAEELAVAEKQITQFGLAETHRILQHGVENRLKLTGELEMTCNTSEVAVCCCKRFAQLVEQARVLDSDDGLAAKFLTSSICFSVKGRTSCR